MTNLARARSRLATRPGFSAALQGGLRERLIQPLIVFSADEEERRAIPSLPGQYLLSLTEAVREARLAARAGIAGVLLFGAPDRHDETALLAAQREWAVPRAIAAIKDAVPELGVATDVCVCAYASHGQCVLFGEGGADVPATLGRLGEIAVAHAHAGADLVMPSGMLEGSVRAIRAALDAAGTGDTAVAGVVKYESALYQPYRDALGMRHITERAVPLLPLGDIAAGVARAERDVADGADVVVVKPGIFALDVVAGLHHRASVPVAAFHVAGEYAMLRAVDGAVDTARLAGESALAMRRAGADLLISYAAVSIADALARDSLT